MLILTNFIIKLYFIANYKYILSMSSGKYSTELFHARKSLLLNSLIHINRGRTKEQNHGISKNNICPLTIIVSELKKLSFVFKINEWL